MSSGPVGATSLGSFARLTPDEVLDAIETIGFHCDGRFLPLNSYENRVYQIGLEDGTSLVAKFYRPNRWSDREIIEEHLFTMDLSAQEIPVIPPISSVFGKTLHYYREHRFALYPNRGGRPPELDNPEYLIQLGRVLGRIHALGAVTDFHYRPRIDIEQYAERPRQFLLANSFIPEHLVKAYASLTQDLVKQIQNCFHLAGRVRFIRIHGDCHAGNILCTDSGVHFVDFDDARMGPAIQDLWMFLSGDRHDMTLQLSDLLEGYTQFSTFNPAELHLVEALRTLRMIHYAAWLANRWDDPAFPMAFPWFNTNSYWENHVLTLREQSALLDEPPLVWR